jgi:hypothetical protein
MDTEPMVQQAAAAAVIHYRAVVDQERIVCMDIHLEAVVDIHKVEEGMGMDKALPLMEVFEFVLKMEPSLMSMIWKTTFALFLTVQAVGRENRDKVACRMERAYNKDTDKDTEDNHKNQGEQNQGQRKELNL